MGIDCPPRTLGRDVRGGVGFSVSVRERESYERKTTYRKHRIRRQTQRAKAHHVPRHGGDIAMLALRKVFRALSASYVGWDGVVARSKVAWLLSASRRSALAREDRSTILGEAQAKSLRE